MWFYFLVCVAFLDFVTILAEIENTRLKVAFATPTSAPITVANDGIETLPLVADKKSKIYQTSQKEHYIY